MSDHISNHNDDREKRQPNLAENISLPPRGAKVRTSIKMSNSFLKLTLII